MDALIVGAGPVGLASALFLAERGIAVRVIDQRDEPTRHSKALVVNPRALDLLAGTGVAHAMVAEGRAIRGVHFHRADWSQLAALDLAGIASPHTMTVLPQARSEALLADALAARGIVPERGVTLAGIEQDDTGVIVMLEAGGATRRETAAVVVGADGAHSTVRKAIGVGFDGYAVPEPWQLYDIELDDPLALDHAHVAFVDRGFIFALALRPGLWRVFGNVDRVLDRLPNEARPGRQLWASEFRISDRRAENVAVGRVALAGDAAHIHSPVGARGMNLGIEDAWVLAGCLAAQRDDPSAALARYAALRQPVHRTVIRRMDLITRMARGRPAAVDAARRVALPVLTGIAPVRHRLRDFMTGLAPALVACEG